MSDFLICFWDKSKIRITGDMAEKLKEAIMRETIKNFLVDDNLYAVAGVEKIIEITEAYRVYPEENEYLQRMEVKQPKFTPLAPDNNQRQLT